VQSAEIRRSQWLERIETSMFSLLKRAPFTPQGIVLKKLLEHVLSEAIADGDLTFLSGRSIEINVSDMGIGWCIGFDGQQFQVTPLGGSPDASINGRARSFVLLAAGREDPDTLFFRRELSLEGDTELSLGIKNLLDSIERDALPFPLQTLLSGAGELASRV